MSETRLCALYFQQPVYPFGHGAYNFQNQLVDVMCDLPFPLVSLVTHLLFL